MAATYDDPGNPLIDVEEEPADDGAHDHRQPGPGERTPHLTGPAGDPRFGRPYGAWEGLGIVSLWTVASVLSGYLALRRRENGYSPSHRQNGWPAGSRKTRTSS
jgi:hypothetical protein